MADFDAEEYPPAGPEEAAPDAPDAAEHALSVEAAAVDSVPAEEHGTAGGDSAAPVITYLTAPGQIARDAVVPVEVTDGIGVATLLITVLFPDTGQWDVIYDGVTFADRYADTVITPIVDGFRYDIAGIDDWENAPTFRTWAIDAAGNTAQDDAAYTLEPLPVPPPGPQIPVSPDPFADTDGLRLAVMISLFSDRRAGADAVLPAGDGDLRGWWADQFATPEGDRIGSHLWLLDRATSADNVNSRAEAFARDALAWLLEDRVASKIDVVVQVTQTAIQLALEIERPHGDPASFRFSHTWDAEMTALSLPPILM